jgi:hypothetical protein
MRAKTFDMMVATAAKVNRRRAVGLAGALAAGLAAGRVPGAAQVETEGAFSRSCDRFVLVGKNNRNGKFDNVDDNMLIELIPKGRKRGKVLWDDTSDDQVNFRGEPFRVKEFKAKVGDKIRIRGYNLEGPCEMDEIWLFCARGGVGKRVRKAYKSSNCPSGAYPSGLFYDETFRIKP